MREGGQERGREGRGGGSEGGKEGGTCRYSRSHEKIAITVQRSPFERRSAFTVHGNDVHF